MRGLGANQKKILLILLAGAALSVNTSPRGVRYIAKAFVKDWRNIDRRSLARSLRTLEEKKYLSFKKKGTFFFPILTAKGRRQAFFADLGQMKVTPTTWDGRWRVVLFDIPEEERKVRNYLRRQLQRMQFFMLQESVFVHAYDCEKEIRKLSDYYGNGAYIRFMEAGRIDDEAKLKAHFELC